MEHEYWKNAKGWNGTGNEQEGAEITEVENFKFQVSSSQICWQAKPQ